LMPTGMEYRVASEHTTATLPRSLSGFEGLTPV